MTLLETVNVCIYTVVFFYVVHSGNRISYLLLKTEVTKIVKIVKHKICGLVVWFKAFYLTFDILSE